MTEEDFAYLLLRLNLNALQPAAKALRAALMGGMPVGYAARQYYVPLSRFVPIHARALAQCQFFTATPQEAASMGLDETTLNAVLAFSRQRELPKPSPMDTVWAQMRDAGISEDVIQRLQASQEGTK